MKTEKGGRMRKIAAIVATTIFLLLLSFPVIAAETTKNEYIVKKGDSLWKIGRLTGTNWREIAKVNKVKKPFTVYIGQKLVIPLWTWKNHGADAYGKKDPVAAVNSFKRLPENIKRRFIDRIQKGKWKWSYLSFGDRREEMVCASGVMGSRSGVIVGGKKDAPEATRRYIVWWNETKYVLDAPLICHNWTWGIVAPKVIKSAVAKIPLDMPVFGEKKAEDKFVDDRFDLYMGGGAYESVNYDAKGRYGWAKLRYRPFGHYNFGDKFDLWLGAFIFGGIGDGDDEDYKYDWKKFIIGPTAKLVGNHWDADIDLGIGKLWNKGGIDLYRGEQVDDICLLSAHGNFYNRRDAGKKWFPKVELNFELNLPYDREHNHSWNGQGLEPDPYDNRSLELFLTQGVYDFNLKNRTRVTPGFNFGYIREYGRAEPNFLQFGPTIVLSQYTEDIISISFLNYKDNLDGDGDQWHWLSGWVSLDGLWRVYKASKIKKPKIEEKEAPKWTENY